MYRRDNIMKVSVSKSKNQTIYYLSKSVWVNGKSTTKTIEKIGSEDDLLKICGDLTPLEWAKQYAAKRSAEEKASKKDIMIKYSSSARIKKGTCRSVNVGYLFLKDIYYDLKIHDICAQIAEKYKFEYDLNHILSMLLFSRIIYPGIRDPRDLLLNFHKSFSKSQAASSITFTERWKSSRKRTTFSRPSFTRIPRWCWIGTRESFTMTAPTITSRLKKQMISENMAIPRKTGRIRLSRWVCLWMRMAFHSPSPSLTEMRMNSPQ